MTTGPSTKSLMKFCLVRATEKVGVLRWISTIFSSTSQLFPLGFISAEVADIQVIVFLP